ncbi:MAG: copper amine oxidase N-terminal domain-containing protein [Clostridiales bacterium]|nr:copper amine oxidase N-terminal domain-containing protein [Clostridiales bacterium]
MYKIGSKTYNTAVINSQTGETQHNTFIKDMDKVFAQNENPNIQIQFGYRWDDVVGRDNAGKIVDESLRSNDRQKLGNIPKAVLTVYDSEGNVRKTHTINPSGGSYPNNLTATYTLTGTIAALGWQKGDYATVYFVGSAQVYDIASKKYVYARTLETSIDFISNTADAVIINTAEGTAGVSQIGKPFYTPNAVFNDNYDIMSITQPGFVTRWLDGSHDNNNDGVNDVSTQDQVFLGNQFPFDVKYTGDNKLYYDYTQSVAGASESGFDLTIVQATYKAIDTTKKIYLPVENATISILGKEVGKTDATGHIQFRAYGITKGSNYLINVSFGGNSYTVYAVAGNGPERKVLEVGDTMRAVFDGSKGIELKYPIDPTSLTANTTYSKKFVGFTKESAILEASEGYSYGLKFKFQAGATAPVTPNTAVLRITKRGDTGATEVWRSPALKIDPVTKMFTLPSDLESNPLSPYNIVTRKDIEKYDLWIEASLRETQNGEEVALYTYPEFPSGISFGNPPALIEAVRSFTGGSKEVDIVGTIESKFSFGVNVSTKEFDKPSYVVDERNQYSLKPRISIGATLQSVKHATNPLTDIPIKETEYLGSVPGGDSTPRVIHPDVAPPKDQADNNKDVTVSDIASALFETSGSAQSKGAAMYNAIDKTSSEEGASIPTGSGISETSSFGWGVDISVDITFDIPYVDDGLGGLKQSSKIFFDSMSLMVTGTAQYANTKTYVTPIGIPIFASIRLMGQLTAVIGVEAKDRDPYRQEYKRSSLTGNIITEGGKEQYYYVYELNELGLPMVYDEAFTLFHKTPDDYFDEYARLFVYPQIKLSAGVGVEMLNVYLSGAAAFDFEFNSPSYNNSQSNGRGGVTLDVSFGIKILFIQKEWSIARKRFSFFEYGNYGAVSEALMASVNDPYTNYLYENADDFEVASREYLNYAGGWNGGSDVRLFGAALEGNDSVSKTLKQGVYPNPKTKLVELGGGNLLMLFADDMANRDEYNRLGVFYTVFNGSTWSEPELVGEDDGTWDDDPDAAIVDDKILVTFSNRDRVFDSGSTSAEVLSSANISGRWFDLSGSPISDAFDITWTSDLTGAKTQDFSHENVYDMFGDSQPKISYDEGEQRLLVYYTKSDYINTPPYQETQGDADTTTIGDLVNAYSVIAFRIAEKDDITGEFVWQTQDDYKEDENYDAGYFGQRLLNLAVPAKVVEEVNTVELEPGYPTTKVTQTVEAINNLNDPRVVMSDVTTYNGLALFTYVMDADSNLKTSTDQEIYMQIYNYEENSFSIPVQLTNNAIQDTKPKYVRVNNITYLYFISGGDIVCMNISDIVKYSLALKEVPGTQEKIYIIDKTNAADPNGFIMTAIEHQINENDGSEKLIEDFSVAAEKDGGGIYLIWTEYTDAPKQDAAQAESNNQATSRVIRGAYSKPTEKREYTPVSGYFQNSEDIEYVYVGDSATTYPSAVRVINPAGLTSPDGTVTYNYGDEIVIDYTTTADINGYYGAVQAGDTVMDEKTVAVEDSYRWSKPITITPADGTCYTDLSFVVNDDNDLTITYVKYKEKDYDLEIDESGEIESSNIEADMTDLSTTELAYGRYILNGKLQASEVKLDNEIPVAGDVVTFSADIINEGLIPVKDIWAEPFAIQNGQEIELLSGNELTKLIGDDVTRSYLLGGDTRTLSASLQLPENIEGIEVGFRVWTESADSPSGEEEILTKTVIASKSEVYIGKVTTSLDADGSTVTAYFTVTNQGNVPFNGNVSISVGETTLDTFEISVDANSFTEVERTVTTTNDMFTIKSAQAEDESIYDAMNLTVSMPDSDVTPAQVEVRKSASKEQIDLMNNIKTFTATAALNVAPGENQTVEIYTERFEPLAEDENDQTEIVWSTNNPLVTVNGNGMISVSEDAPAGTTATITAFLKPENTVVSGNFNGTFDVEQNLYTLPDTAIKQATTQVTVTSGSAPAPAYNPPLPPAIPTATATPVPDDSVISASKDGTGAAVEIVKEGANVLETEFKVTAPSAQSAYQTSTKVTVDVSGLTDTQKENLSGVLYNDSGVGAKNLGGVLSADGKTFTFDTYDATGVYGVRQVPELLFVTVHIGTTEYESQNTHDLEQPFDVAPYIDTASNRTMVPVRFIAESLGAKVEWDDPTDTVTITLGDKTVSLVIGTPIGDYGAPVITNSRTFVPARYVLEQFGANVVWDESTQSVSIYK